MTDGSGGIVPLRVDLPALVPHSVAVLYKRHLVTRPTGQALRLGIESQIEELGALCLSVLDFSQVIVLDYSCADETVAKLLQRYLREDRPAEAYFIARGVGEHHREAIETVLVRQGCALVAELNGAGTALLGETTPLERAAWFALERAARAAPDELAAQAGLGEREMSVALDGLARRRVIFRQAGTSRYRSLSSLLRAGP